MTVVHFQARNDTANEIAEQMAHWDGHKRFDSLSADERLSYRGFADRILVMVEHKLAAQNKSLSDGLKHYWTLPA